MSEKTEVDQEYDDGNASVDSINLPEHQYSRKELYDLSQSPASRRRPQCLEKKFDNDDGKWDPERWCKAKDISSREGSPLSLETKDRRKGLADLEIKKRPVNDSVERLKDKDVIVLSPQRRSFGTGCHVQNPPSYTRQLSIPERDEPKGERERDRERDRDRDRPVRKIGSGRIQIDKENYRDRDRDRDRYDDRDIRDRDRDRDYAWNRDRDRDRGERDREWERDVRDRDRDRDRDVRDLRDDWDRDRDRDRRFDRSDRFRRLSDRDFQERGDRPRDREFYNRDRGYDKHSRRRNMREEEKEPEWFTGGPTSQLETIELRGFDKEADMDMEEGVSLRPNAHRHESKRKGTPPNNKSFQDYAGEVSESEVKASQRSSPEDDQLAQKIGDDNQTSPNESPHAVAEKSFHIDDIFNSVPFPETCGGEGQQVSRFSRFFTARGTSQGTKHEDAVESTFVPHGLLEESRTSPAVRSPIHLVTPGSTQPHHLQQLPNHHNQPFHPSMKPYHLTNKLSFMDHQQHLVQGQEQADRLRYLQYQLHPEQQQHYQHMVAPMNAPTSAGDNSVGHNKADNREGNEPLSASVTALFSAAAASSSAAGGGGSNACKWKPTRLDSSVSFLDSPSFFIDSAISSGTSFSSQDASAQLKAMLFGGANKESAPSSGTASPANLLPGVHKVKTLAELEADLHQDISKSGMLPSNTPTPANNSAANLGQEGGSGDMTAFNKLLFLVNAASETSQNEITSEPQNTRPGYHMIPSHSQFSNAMLRNKEEQKILQQQSLHKAPVGGPLQDLHSAQQLPPFQNVSAFPPPGKLHSMTPQAMSTPAVSVSNQRPHSSSSSDPILSLIQQNPSILMKPPSPAVNMAAFLAAQQQHANSMAKTARVPSPLMFSQQPPQHLSAPSPIRTGQLSPGNLAMGENPAQNPNFTGTNSPVQIPNLSPQELSAHAQAVMQGALLKRQLQDQNERSLKKHLQERPKSPSQPQLRFVKPQSTVQPVIPPNPQSKGSAVNTFTPTSVLRKMHSDKAMIKERQAQESKSEEDMEYMPSMHEAGNNPSKGDLLGLHKNVHQHQQRPASATENTGNCGTLNSNGNSVLPGENLNHHTHSLSDISFLDPVNPDLVAMSNQMESQLYIGSGPARGGVSGAVLPATLSQPMSVEEKIKLSSFLEKREFLSQMDKSKAAAEASQLRPIVKGTESNVEERALQQQLQQTHILQQQQMQSHQGGRPVTGSGANLQQPPPHSLAGPPPAPLPQAPMQQLPSLANKPGSGRAIVGTSSIHQQSHQVPDMRMMEHQPHMPHFMPGMVLPPPPLGPPMACPPPVAIPIAMPVTGAPGGRMPILPGPVLAPPQGRPTLLQQQQQMARVNALNAQRQQLHLAMQQQHRSLGPLQAVVAPNMAGQHQPLSPRTSQGPLSPAALSATIQRVASPQGTQLGLNGPMPLGPGINGGSQQQQPQVSKVDIGGGIQRWFSPDILKTQLPSMPPLPTQGNKVMTVDELERA